MAARKRRSDEETPAEARNNVVEAPIVPRRLSVSEMLRARRIECDLELDYVAQVLRIRSGILEAIETGRFDELPGPVYAIGFVRSYATYLGLDAEALVLRFKDEVADVARKPHLNFPLPVSDSRVPTGPILLICVLLAAGTYGGWYYFTTERGQLADIVPAVPDRLNRLLTPAETKNEVVENAARAAQPAPVQQSQTAAAPAPTPPQAAPAAIPAPAAAPVAPPSAEARAQAARPAAPAAAPASPVPTPAVPVESDGVPPVEDRPGTPSIAAALPPAPDLTQPAVSDPGKAPPQTDFGAPAAEARVVLHAVADSWIEVRDRDGNLLFTRLLKAGDTYNVPNQAGLTMVTGSAGGLDVSVDGVNVPRMGETGQVVRNIALDPARLLAGRPRAN